jgi:hypothetical protein
MTTLEANRTSELHRAPRLWIVETLVVLGVIAFGYFAVTMDTSFLGALPATEADPLLNLLQ